MDSDLKKILRAVSLELRHTLEGTYDERGGFHPGDLEDRLNALGVWRDRPAKPLSELGYLPDEDKEARRVVDAYLAFRAEAGVGQGEAVAEFVRESAYTWANRLLCLRCMEARGIIDEVILQKEVYGWRSMVHNRLGRQDPALLATPDEGLFAVLSREFELRARELPGLFNPKAPAIALRPSLAALKKCIGLLSGMEKAGSNGEADDAVFAAPDALGWAYQYWNAEEKDRVFEKVRTERGAKIEGADIIPATQLYTEPYMVKFLVQNSLGALWMGMHPDSNLADDWEYYVRDADRAPVEQKRVHAITFLDPACGSGHFHLEAFDLLYAMYEEEGELSEPESICAAILNHNLYGVDIDERAVQIAQAALWMKAKEIAWDLEPKALTDFHHHFVATNIRLPRGKDHLEAFLRKHPEDLPLRPALETVFAGLENAHELGSLLQLEEPVEKELRFLRGKQEEAEQEGFQSALFAEMGRPRQGKLPVGVESYDAWKNKILSQLRQDFEAESEAADLTLAFFGQGAGKGLALFDILARRYDAVAANPPYLGVKNMSERGRRFLESHFGAAKADLFGGFFLQAWNLLVPSGRLAFVTLHTWMYIDAFSELREYLLTSGFVELVAHLGIGTMKELSNPNAQGFAMQIVAKSTVDFNNLSNVLDVTGYADKATGLLELVTENANGSRRYALPQGSFLKIHGSPFAYALPKTLLRIMSEGQVLGEKCDFMAGISTGSTSRFLRFHWEVPSNSQRWNLCIRGGPFSRYYSSIDECMSTNLTGIQEQPGARVYKLDWFGKECAGYTLLSSYGFSARYVPEGLWYERAGNFIFPLIGTKITVVLAIANSLLTQFILKQLNPTMAFEIGDVKRLPYVDLSDSQALDAVKKAIATKQSIVALDVLSIDFDARTFETPTPSLQDLLREIRDRTIEKEYELALLAAVIDKTIIERLELSETAVRDICRIVGPPVWYVEENPSFLEEETLNYPAETSVEKLVFTKRVRITEALQELRSDTSGFADLAQDRLTVSVMRLLGHRWPSQAEIEELDSSWVDKDGIVPITSGGHGEATLYDRLREKIARDFQSDKPNIIEHEFAAIVGESLDNWLAGSFFKRHLSQFKKSPIAWQLKTAIAQRGRGNPAFSCLIYYHRLDADLLPKIRSQYIRDLRRGYETEQRTLRQMSSRTADQDARLMQLDSWLDELNAFAEKLEQVSVSGFGDTPTLQAQLRQFAIDDAMQSLKAVWLRRLAAVVASGPLQDWQRRAAITEIHFELGDWIAAAMDSLNHHCASVGAKSPQAGKLKSDPDARALAAVIGTQAARMVKQAISLACDVWFDDLDSHVLRPALDEINELKAQVTEQEEKLNDLGAHETRARYDVEQAIKSLKARIKKLTKARNEQRKKAKELREHIEGWTCPEAAGWTEWLGTQPLFDQFASSDGQKSPPRTIADFVAQESRYDPDINDGVRVNIAPLQKAGLLAADVLAAKDVDKAIADRADWRADERRWCREGKLPRPGWWAVGD